MTKKSTGTYVEINYRIWYNHSCDIRVLAVNYILLLLRQAQKRNLSSGKDCYMKKIDIYTDGSCKKNPGPGGWAAILVWNGHEKEISGGMADTTNNRMELTAVIEALSCLKEECDVSLTSDSKYVTDGITKGWAKSWKAHGWKKSDRSPALNPDLWERLLELCSRHNVEFIWVKGHAGHPYNERCDAMAQAQAEKYI